MAFAQNVSLKHNLDITRFTTLNLFWNCDIINKLEKFSDRSLSFSYIVDICNINYKYRLMLRYSDVEVYTRGCALREITPIMSPGYHRVIPQSILTEVNIWVNISVFNKDHKIKLKSQSGQL